MGISGLLPSLKEIQVHGNISDFKGKRLAVDVRSQADSCMKGAERPIGIRVAAQGCFRVRGGAGQGQEDDKVGVAGVAFLSS